MGPIFLLADNRTPTAPSLPKSPSLSSQQTSRVSYGIHMTITGSAAHKRERFSDIGTPGIQPLLTPRLQLRCDLAHVARVAHGAAGRAGRQKGASLVKSWPGRNMEEPTGSKRFTLFFGCPLRFSSWFESRRSTYSPFLEQRSIHSQVSPTWSNNERDLILSNGLEIKIEVFETQ